MILAKESEPPKATAMIRTPPRASGRELLDMKASMLAKLDEQHARRRDYAGTAWLDAEIDCMHRAVNEIRVCRGLPTIDRAHIARADRMAAGHTDYASKFSLYCAALALGPWKP